MEPQKKNLNSLHNRVNDFLRGKPVTYIVEESEEVTIEAIFDQLHKAEADLRALQERVDRLRWSWPRRNHHPPEVGAVVAGYHYLKSRQTHRDLALKNSHIANHTFGVHYFSLRNFKPGRSQSVY